MDNTSSVLQFFTYLRTFNRFYGSDTLTLPGFVTLYLDYDTDYNPVRKFILENTLKDNFQMNTDCLAFILSNPEKPVSRTILSTEEYLGKSIRISHDLDAAVSQVINSENQESKKDDIHKFMYNLFLKNNFEEYFSKVFGIDFNDMLEKLQSRVGNFTQERNYLSREIPEALQQYATIIDGKREDYNIGTREDEKDIIWNTLYKSFCNNVFIISEYHDSPEEFIFNMAYQVEHDKSSTLRMMDRFFVHIDFQELVVKNFCVEDLAKKVQEVVKMFLDLNNKNNIIIFMQNINSLMVIKDKGINYLHLLTPLFDDKDLRVIVNMTESEYKIFSVDWRLYKNFYSIWLDEPIKEEVVPSIMPSIFRSSIYHGVVIYPKMIETAKLFAKALDPDDFIPGYKNVIDYAMGIARSIGRNFVREDDFIENFKIAFHEYEKLSKEFRELVAYHEAGHFTVSRFCEHFKAVYSDLISVVSTEDFGGVNIMDFDPSMVKDYGYEFYLEELAVTLAGRASEELFLGGISSGAEEDLSNATALATIMISNLGLDKSINFAIKGNDNLRSEKSINEVSDKVNGIMDEAYDKAVEMLMKYEQYVHVLAELLLERKIISRNKILSYETEENGIVVLKRKEDK